MRLAQSFYIYNYYFHSVVLKAAGIEFTARIIEFARKNYRDDMLD